MDIFRIAGYASAVALGITFIGAVSAVAIWRARHATQPADVQSMAERVFKERREAIAQWPLWKDLEAMGYEVGIQDGGVTATDKSTGELMFVPFAETADKAWLLHCQGSPICALNRYNPSDEVKYYNECVQYDAQVSRGPTFTSAQVRYRAGLERLFNLVCQDPINNAMIEQVQGQIEQAKAEINP